ncbi:MAG TPA: wax ester/triacylglycerol synthase family O-acyltransferase [Aldersonia sp.]
MVSRLTPQDATFHSLESSKNPVAIGSLAILDNSNGALDYETLLELVEERLFLVPRYRMKVREVPFGLGAPVWIDDRDFDVTYHVRRSALPKPGTREQLHDLVARLISRPFDTTRPLWEMFLVEAVAGNRVALFIKTSAALVDGTDALEIGHVILDTSSEHRDVAADLWLPADEPSPVSLAVGALAHLVTRPVEGVAVWRRRIEEVGLVMESAVKALSGMVGVLGVPTSSAPTSPLNATTSRNRRVSMASTDLEDYRRVRAHSGGSINDVVLAVIAGALRSWLQSRGEPITGSTTLRAVVPMSVYLDESGPQSTVTSFLIDLPVGEPNPVIRLSHIAHATKAQGSLQLPVTARTLVRLSGFAPASMHAMSVRAAAGFSQRTFNLVITNAPGPQVPMYVGGSRMLEMYPVSPLLRNQALSIGITSYDGRVYYGFNADRDAMADVDVVTALIGESMEELLDACS